MNNRRLPRLSRWLAGLYLVWSLFIYFGTLGREGHSFWPLWLYFIIWPLSLAHNVVSSACQDLLFPDTKSTPNWAYALNDYMAGAFYIIVGTMWLWFLGVLI